MTEIISELSSYVSASAARSYCDARSLAYEFIKDDAEFDALLLQASEMLDGVCQFQGHKAASGQAREWPRNEVIDEAGLPITTIPDAVIFATIQLALLLANDKTEAERALGLAGRIQSERIGDIEVRYRADTRPATRLLTSLWPYLVASKPIRVTRS